MKVTRDALFLILCSMLGTVFAVTLCQLSGVFTTTTATVESIIVIAVVLPIFIALFSRSKHPMRWALGTALFFWLAIFILACITSTALNVWLEFRQSLFFLYLIFISSGLYFLLQKRIEKTAQS